MNSQEQQPKPENDPMAIAHEMALEAIETVTYMLATLPSDSATTEAAKLIARQLVGAAGMIRSAVKVRELEKQCGEID